MTDTTERARSFASERHPDLVARRGARKLAAGLTRLRGKQIRGTSRFIEQLHKVSLFSAFFRGLARAGLSKPLARGLVGYRRAYPSLPQATRAIEQRDGGGHAASWSVHASLVEEARPSDYAALFHMSTILPRVARVFDMGGSVGNIFYLYDKIMRLPQALSWTVQDIPAVVAEGRTIATDRGEQRLRFTTDLQDASGCDLLLASGSMHYLASPLHEVVQQWVEKPRWILINRTPMTDRASFAAIQEGNGYRVACMIFNKAELIRGFEQIGYDLVDQWEVPELSVRVPLDPAHDVPFYSGMFLTLREPGSAAAAAEQA